MSKPALDIFDYRVRTRLSDESVEKRMGKLPVDEDRRVLVEGPARFFGPDGQPVLIYLPGVVKEEMDEAFKILRTIKGTTENRGTASGTAERVVQGNQRRGIPTSSAIVGAYEASGYYRHCRLTSWTAKQAKTNWPALFPLFQACAHQFKQYAPERYAAQMRYVDQTPSEWIIEGTPYSTVTVNDTWATALHLDQGDLDEGFSCLAVARRGKYTGGILTLPKFGLGVDLQDGDMVLMNAHEAHSNTRLFCKCGKEMGISVGHAGTGACKECGAQRISTVLYFRTNMAQCGTANEEAAKALTWAEKINVGSGVEA